MERRVSAGGIELCTTTTGDPGDPTVLLVMGLGLSYDWWRDDSCDALAARGLHVVRFDNRDVGRSTHLSGPGISAWGFLTRRARPVYTLGDMADDADGHPPSGGRATAAAVPGAELLELPGMGHDLARATWPAVIDGIARTVERPSRTRA